MVFQNYALYPHMTVRANLAFALELRKLPASEIERRVRLAADTLGLDEVLGRKPRQLSGGQRAGFIGSPAMNFVEGAVSEYATVTAPARIDLIEPLGNETLVHATVGSHSLTARALERELPNVGASVNLGIEPAKVHWFDQATGDRIASGLS
jgi:ABC-type sugar transport system ATPase subunit